jgi:hypothetical protein
MAAIPEGRGYIVPEASNPTVASEARSGRILIAEDQVVYFKQQSQQPLTRLRVAI